MKPVAYLVLLAAGLSIAGAYIRFVHDPYVRRVAALETERDSSNRANDSLRHELVEHAQLDTIRQDSIAVLLRLARRPITHPATDTLARGADSLEALAETQADSASWRAIHDAFAAKDSVIWQVKQDGIHDLDQVRGELLGALALDSTSRVECRSDNAKLLAALNEVTVERDRWRKVARPGLVLRVLRDLPKVAIGVALGVTAGVLVGR